MAEIAQEGSELVLIGVERERARLPHGGFEARAKRLVLRDERSIAFDRAFGRRETMAVGDEDTTRGDQR